jgi:hypothetical protein
MIFLHSARSRLYQNHNQKSFDTVFEKKENLGVRAKQNVRLTRLGEYYVVQYYTASICVSTPIFASKL